MRPYIIQGHREHPIRRAQWLLRTLDRGGDTRVGNYLSGDRGEIINLHGYKFRFHHYEKYLGLWQKPIFEFTLNDFMPLTFKDTRGWAWRPDNHFFTDGGSVPMSLQWLFPPLEALPGYIFHDSACLHGGLWAYPPGEDWQFYSLGRRARDNMLAEIQEVCGVSAWRRGCIWLGVRAFALATGQWS